MDNINNNIGFIKNLCSNISSEYSKINNKIDTLKKESLSISNITNTYVKYSLNKAEILNKYYYDTSYQHHNNLPGIDSSVPITDIETVKKDQDFINDINNSLASLKVQKAVSQRILRESFKELFSLYKKTLIIDQSITEAIVNLNDITS